jgi:hypothetical protein
MVTIILAIALLVALAGLGVEIGIASWNIRMANRYRRRESAAEYTSKQAIGERQDMADRMESLNEDILKISWLLKFLYSYYDKFSDLEKEIEAGSRDLSGDISAVEADAGYKNLEKALEIIKAEVPEWRLDRKSVNEENAINSSSPFNTGADEIPVTDAEALNS